MKRRVMSIYWHAKHNDLRLYKGHWSESVMTEVHLTYEQAQRVASTLMKFAEAEQATIRITPFGWVAHRKQK